MSSKTVLVLAMFVAALFAPDEAAAQFFPGKKAKGSAATQYRKMSGDTLRLRKSKQAELEKKEKAEKAEQQKKRSAAKRASARKEKKERVDSVAYEPRQYYLGDRVIMRGDSGHDVREAAKYLVNKLYLDESEIVYTKDGGALYEDNFERALKHFQEFNGMYPDGIIGSEVVKALRKRKK